jgi:uncharacterized membrane protein
MFRIGKQKGKQSSNNWLFGTMLAFGVLGLLASFVLSVEEFYLLKNPNAILSCSFNIVLNCATVMKTWQAAVFGFPNMFIGLMSYPVVITVAVAGLSGVIFKRWFLITANICYVLGAIFAYWLFFNSVYVIEILCPWCLLVTFVTTILLATITQYNLRENSFKLQKSTQKSIQQLLERDVLKMVTAGWIVLMIALVFFKFGEGLVA